MLSSDHRLNTSDTAGIQRKSPSEERSSQQRTAPPPHPHPHTHASPEVRQASGEAQGRQAAVAGPGLPLFSLSLDLLADIVDSALKLLPSLLRRKVAAVGRSPALKRI